MILWFIKILRSLFAFCDKIFYTLIVLVYELFMLISQAGVFSQAAIQEFAARIYVFLGLIMVFKVSISLVTYILNPDNFNKADVGAPALLKGFAFALIGIVLVPYVFEAAYSLQNIVLKDNLIGNLIMGMSDDNNDSDDYIRDAGVDMSFVTLTAFIRLDTQFPQISEACAANPVDVTPGATADDDATGTLSAECSGLEEVLGDEGVQLLTDAYAKRSIAILTDGDLLNITSKLDDKDEFVMNYLPIISTAAGVFIAYVILLFCIDIAVRSVKLGFLQLIAPIPLIAKIDPKKGGEKFKKWMEECVSTYLDVFLRLAAIYFILFIISMITTSGNSGIYNIVTGEGFSGISGIFVKIFIIIGALNFARDLPKLLAKILGIDFKGTGGFTLNPMKKISSPGLGLAAGGLAGMAGGALGNFQASRELGRNRLVSGLSAAGGLLSGGLRGGSAGLKSASKDGKMGFDAGLSASGKGAQRLLKNAGTSFDERAVAKVQSSLGLQTAAQRQDETIKNLNDFKKSVDTIDKAAEGQALKTDRVKAAQAKIDALKSSGPGKVAINRQAGESDTQYQARYSAARAAAQAKYENDLKGSQNAYVDELKKVKKEIATATMQGTQWLDNPNDPNSDMTGKIRASVSSEIAGMKALMNDESSVRDAIGFNSSTPIDAQIDAVIANYDSMDKASVSASTEVSRMTTSDEYRTAHKVDKAAGVKNK